MSIFCSEWKSEKIGDILKERKEIGFSNLPLLSVTAEKGVVKRNEIDIKDNSSADKSNYKRICPFDIGYNTMRMWQGRSGVSEYEGIVSPAYTVLKPTSKVDSNFIGYLFKLPAMINIFRRYSQGLVNDTLSLKYNQLKNITIKIPSFREQKKIARILNVWDEAIALKKDLIELKKEQKKGLMNYLLTGKSRFPGFIDKWEETEIGKLAEVVSGVTPPTSNKKYWGGKIPWCTPTDITKSSKYIKKTEKTITKEALKENRIKLLPENSILMCSRATIGPRSINKVPMTTNQGFKSFICFEEKIDNEFLYYLIGILEKKFVSLSNGSTFLELSKKDLLKTQVKIPKLKEQKVIAKVLAKVDKEIELLEKELEYLKEQKKGLMQLLLTGKVRVKC